jgi:cytochrome oxidase assembly protein ShyY1
MVFAFGITIICFSLGQWQLRRREWKINLIEWRKARLARPPLQLSELLYYHHNRHLSINLTPIVPLAWMTQ